ncbi:DUF4145 domain-containing protein [Paracoccus sp. DMF-8]|uniref:DUF4145 domain-containing protein n=1 Tax=Paracoccus sp. DMF-8 TaxID=3019445 RepID=UPI0023E86EDC|nr:DUF4145 domain-containing protein [Paracoccus sp. DMF-8]MDF3606110.1 DUF4145 domain-containing protein [Paracoccus sp. DMF-8]
MDISTAEGVRLVNTLAVARMEPQYPSPRPILHMPQPVQNAFEEAEANFADQRWPSAATGYRRAIERALKVLHPEARGMLNERIRALEKQNSLPPSMIALMDNIKFLGNDGAHEMEDPEANDVAVGRDFATLLLTYLFELPERVRLATVRRNKAAMTEQ